ncbi:MAG: 50S ribosomal protein L3 [Deltaproteobacteria bacterium]|nr:50S ribosomal protein L3 [Deltaproteobacteria bacterium]MDL1976751.1 50S ribosomal protein L3 [Deltaproteobacteria bacterium]
MLMGLLGKKIGMSSMYSPDGRRLPVTVLKVGPCVVTQVKTMKDDGYEALQLGFEEKNRKRVNRPLAGHFKKSGEKAFQSLREFFADNCSEFKEGQTLTVDIFSEGERVDISGRSKGRGFAGVVKRWGFHGGNATHGSNFHRAPGAIGMCAWPAKVRKGLKLPGHYGDSRVTVKGLEIVGIEREKNLLIIKGAVPGSCGNLVEVRKQKG